MRRSMAALAGLWLLAGCATERQPAPSASDVALVAGMPGQIRYLSPERDESGTQAIRFWQQLARRAAEHPVNLLAISGGGADSAFGAGALLGMHQRSGRIDYDVVTGVSSGALLAPFALLGAAWDASLETLFDPRHGRTLLRLRPGRSGLYSSRPLKALIHEVFTDDLIRAVANEAARGRTLLVGTTDLDAQSPVVWDLTAVAALDTPASRTLFRQVLLATSSYPGLLPPVLIDVSTAHGARQEMHVDGGTAQRLFLGPPTEHLEPDAIPSMPQLHAFALINRRLNAVPGTISDRTIPVLRRALSTQSRLTTRATLTIAAEFAQRHGFELKVANIEGDGNIPLPFSFDDPGLTPLFQTGQRRATSDSLWRTPAQALNPAQRTTVVEAGN